MASRSNLVVNRRQSFWMTRIWKKQSKVLLTERCITMGRTAVHVQESVQKENYEKVIQGLKERAEKIKLGPGMNDDTDMGPLVSKKQQRTVLDYIEKGKAEGARLITGGTAPFDKGYYVEPTIFAD